MGEGNTMEAYDKFAEYYDTYVGDFKDDITLYLSFCEKGDKILEVGCRTGRVIKYLLDKSLTSITGVDTSEEMLARARKKLNKYLNNNILTLQNHDFSKEPLKTKFNKVFITFYTFNYVVNEPDKFLKNIYLSMENNSLIVIDLFYPKVFLNPELDNVWVEREIVCENDRLVKLREKRSFDGEFEKGIQVFTEDSEESIVETLRKYYSREEIEELLYRGRFRNTKLIYGYSMGDSSKLTDDYPLFGFNELNIDPDKYANREEPKHNFVVYAHKYQ